jgi:hypothetical protein
MEITLEAARDTIEAPSAEVRAVCEVSNWALSESIWLAGAPLRTARHSPPRSCPPADLAWLEPQTRRPRGRPLERRFHDGGSVPDVNNACFGDAPIPKTMAALDMLRRHLPDLRVRLVNVVDLT